MASLADPFPPLAGNGGAYLLNESGRLLGSWSAGVPRDTQKPHVTWMK